MTTVTPNANRNAGLTRSNRFSPALASDYALVDERKMAHFLEFGRRYARLLNFCEVDGSSEKDWSIFFENDFGFLLAEICVAVETPAPPDVSRAYNLELEITQELEVIYSLLSRIDQWQSRASAIDNAHLERPANQLTLSLRALITQDLSPILDTILKNVSGKTKWDAIAQEQANGAAPPFWYEADIWKLNNASSDESVENTNKTSLQSSLNYLQSTEKDLRFQYGKLGKLAREYLEENLSVAVGDDSSDKANHAPHVALYVAFLQLMQVLRADVNSYTERHLDYYYRDILRLSEDPGMPDKASVMLTLATGVVNQLVPLGTALAGGKDEDGNDIVFLTDNDINVNRASIGGLRTLYSFRETARATPTSQTNEAPQASGKPRWVRRVWAALNPSAEDGQGQALTRKDLGWPAFGNFNYDNLLDDNESDLLATYDNRVDLNHQAIIGSLITSEALLLQEGERTVTLTFRCQNNGDANDLLNNLLERYKPGSSGADATTRASYINTIFQDGWQVYVSTVKEWHLLPLPQFTSGSDKKGIFLGIVFALSAGDPAMVSNPKLPEVPDSPWPSIKLLVNPTANLYLYSFFAQLQVNRVDIAIDVGGIGNLSLQGNLGPIASGKPFAAFGAMPAVGNYFQVAHAELGKQGLQTAAISIDWQPLPDDLKAYYAGYGALDFDPARFKVDLTVSLDGEWHMAATSPMPLFGANLKTSQLNWVPPVQSGNGPFAAAVDVPAGSARFALTGPSYAFGHADYPNFFADQALNNAVRIVQSKSGSSTPKFDAINRPLTPTVKSISLAYTAFDSVDLSNVGTMSVTVSEGATNKATAGTAGGMERQQSVAKYRYIYPFGCGVPQMGNPTILPPDDGGSDGHLYIGIAGLDLRKGADPNIGVDIGCRIVLHLQFCEQVAAEYKRMQVAPKPRDIDTAISWRYLSNNIWKPFDKSSLVSYTKDFQISGLVMIDLPTDITDRNTIMPNGMLWIEAGAVGEVCNALIVDILPNSVTATRTLAPSGQVSLPPASISGFQKKIAKVKTVLQPYATIGGRAREKKSDAQSTQQYRARVSERLKHKQRASQPGDYEKLALNQFPQLSQAKCVTANNSRSYEAQGRVSPGEVLLVVMPQMSDLPTTSADGAISPPLPMSKQVLGEIGAYLQQCASPFVRMITVRNPVYRCLKVKVRVRFRNDGKFGGYVPRLNAAISDFIAPWLRDPSAGVTLGGGALYIEKLNSAIANLPYVEQVWRDSLSVKFTDAAGEPNHDLLFAKGVAVPDTPWMVFVPYAKHAIITQQVEAKPLPPPAPAPQGIGAMTVGGDFIVGPESEAVTPKNVSPAIPKPYQLIIPQHMPRSWR